MGEVIQVGYYILLFLPGFIFVQVLEHHLLREKKPQLEKTLEITLASALIWMIAFAVPHWWPFGQARNSILEMMLQASGSLGIDGIQWTRGRIGALARLFVSVCLWSFILANTWGVLRKARQVEALFVWLTGRDWYPSVNFKFFKSSVDRAVVVETASGRYLGLLFSAPDTQDDAYIVLSDVSFIPQRGDSEETAIEPLPLVDKMLFSLEETKSIQLLGTDVLTARNEVD